MPRSAAACRAGSLGLESPLAPKAPHFPAKAKACIVLFMYGGVSQVDTFDPKPELTRHNGKPIPTLDSDPVLKGRNPGDAAGLVAQVRPARPGRDRRSPTFIPTSPAVLDDVAIIRSMYADSFAHGSGLLQMNTGFVRQGYPEHGLVGDLRAGNGQPEPAGLRRPARPARRADLRPAQLGLGLHAGDLPGDPVSHQRRPDLEPAAAATESRPPSSATSSTFWPSSSPPQQRRRRQRRAVGPHRQLRAGLPDAGAGARGRRPGERVGRDEAALRARRPQDRAVRPALPDGAPAGRARRPLCAGLFRRRPQRRKLGRPRRRQQEPRASLRRDRPADRGPA